jgi:redox-sensitive transcriptional activator SoxR
MRVGEVAERAGVNVETLRYYVRRGLLPAPERTPSGHRRYDDETVRFLRAIKEAQAVGFTLAEITEYLRAARRSQSPSQDLRLRMAAKIDEIDSRIASLRRIRDELARVVGCACTSLDHCTCGAAYLVRQGKEPTLRPALLHVTNGLLRRGAQVRVIRDSTVIYTTTIDSLKRFQDDVREVQEGFECGLHLQNFDDVKVGDTLECFETREVERTSLDEPPSAAK